jgi:SHAQKYF class myb-like DNA-binding protein
MDGSTNQPNHGQTNFGPPYQHDHNYANHLTLSPQSGTQASTYAELGAGITSPYAGISNGDTNNNNAMDALTAAAVAAKPSTPQSVSGQVVETGREHTGRWTKEEHDAFLTGLQMYGKEWKKVAARVKTRTVVQTRTHAQKYFQKLQRVMEVSMNGILFLLFGSCFVNPFGYCCLKRVHLGAIPVQHHDNS